MHLIALVLICYSDRINIGPNPYDEIPDEPEIRCPDERCRKKQKTG